MLSLTSKQNQPSGLSRTWIHIFLHPAGTKTPTLLHMKPHEGLTGGSTEASAPQSNPSFSSSIEINGTQKLGKLNRVSWKHQSRTHHHTLVELKCLWWSHTTAAAENLEHHYQVLRELLTEPGAQSPDLQGRGCARKLPAAGAGSTRHWAGPESSH